MSELQSMQTEAERLFESAADSLSDDIVGRLGSPPWAKALCCWTKLVAVIWIKRFR